MKKLVISVILIVALLYVFYVVMKPAAIAPNGELRSPSPTPSPTPTANITVSSPVAGQLVTRSIAVTGMARVFEQQFNWQLTDTSGNILAQGTAMSHATDAGLFGPYTFTIAVPSSAPTNLVIRVFDYSARDGSVQDLVVVPVRTQ